MEPVFRSGLCVSKLVNVAPTGQRIGGILIPPGHTGLATVCSVVINGTLLKAGIPIDSRFGGILQMRDRKPVRFTELIHYDGCSLDPSEVFMKAGMTSSGTAALTGYGEILANFREIPAMWRPLAQEVIEAMSAAGLNGVLVFGATSEDVCEIGVGLNKVGVVLLGGLNPVAAAVEAGVQVKNYSMCTVLDYRTLVSLDEVLEPTVRSYSLSA